MKKLLYSFATMLMICAAIGMVACSKDKDKDEPDAPATEKKVKEAQVTASLYVSQTIADLYDISGKSASGKEVNLSSSPVDVQFKGNTVSMYVMTVDVTGNTLPQTAEMSINYTLKPDAKVADTNDFAIAIVASGSIAYTDGTNAPYSASGQEIESKGIKGENIDRYTDYLNRNFSQIKATLDSNGMTLE